MPSPFLTPELKQECSRISPLSPDRLAEAQARLDSLAKPVGSLGQLETMASQLHAIQESARLAARPARMLTIAADHGVVAEKIASSPQKVTALMVQNFLAGGAAINALCAAAGVELRIVDAGVAAPPFPEHPFLLTRKIAPGTANMVLTQAMTQEQCAQALQLGVTLAEQAHQDGIRVLGTGEMGIGNTTASSALFCAYLGFSAAEMTGIGAGTPKAGLAHKTMVIEKALQRHAEAITHGDPVLILAALGGLEIAALAGMILGAAARRMAVMVDGFIATAAFVAAWKLAPAVRGFCFFSHGSAEAGHARVLEHLGAKPLLNLGMRLGEGTGAALGCMLLDAASRVYNDMAALADAGIIV